MPGKILQNMTKVGVRNPLFLLDEVDKMGMDFRGDPASALLEVLDPEQNHTFVDHYVEVEYDLSDVMFVATANTLNIPPALLDRMEVIRLSGYTEDEKVNIAQRHLLPKLMKNHGLKPEELALPESACATSSDYYTREAGAGIEREMSKICRKVVKELVKAGENRKLTVSARNLDKYLGVRRYTFGMAEKNNQVGQVNGLAWTEVGGELLTIEAATMPGKGKMTTTGKLGEVMQESVQAALSVVRARSRRLGSQEILPEERHHITCRRRDAKTGQRRHRSRPRDGSALGHPRAPTRVRGDHAARRMLLIGVERNSAAHAAASRRFSFRKRT